MEKKYALCLEVLRGIQIEDIFILRQKEIFVGEYTVWWAIVIHAVGGIITVV